MQLSRAELDGMAAAAKVVRACRHRAAIEHLDIVGELTGGAAAEWRHYPEGEVYDPTTHAQFFYHRHGRAERPAREDGHFHVFLRAEGMPPGVAPLILPELAIAEAAVLPPQAAPLKRGNRDEVAHLVAIAVDRRAEPIRLFTTNRWVTAETWYPAGDVIRMLDRLAFSQELGLPRAAFWVAALIWLFRPQIAELLRARDETVMAWRRRRRGHVFEDRRLEIASSLAVDLDGQLALVEGAGAQRAESAAITRRAALPPMAEGWGEA